MATTSLRQDPFGLWSLELRRVRGEGITDVAAEVESLGFGTLWIPGAIRDSGGSLWTTIDAVLGSTVELKVATAVVNIWAYPADTTAAAAVRLSTAYPGRLILGIGVGQPEHLGDDGADAFRDPIAKMARYLDELDALGVGADDRVLAALGPKMLHLAGTRATGAHPYLVTPEHTAMARDILGPEPVLAPEQPVIIEPDPGRAREKGREYLAFYLQLRNYVANLRRMGFNDEDLADGGSDRLVDSIVAWGDQAAIVERLRAHLAAGADHVAVHVVGEGRNPTREEWRQLAPALVNP
jgi:probable F420-dependent oxidoreductase